MGRKRKKDDYPEEWDVVDETQDPDAIPPLFELVAETQDSDTIPLPFETVSETQDLDAKVDAVTDALSQLLPPSQKPLVPPTYRIKETTKEINSSVICKLTRICRFPLLVEEIKKVCVVMKQVQLEGWHLANLHVLRCLKEGDEVPKLEQMFFYRCCMATLGNIEKRDRRSTESKYLAFHKTCLRYWAGRERESAYEPEFIQNAGAMVNEMAKLMEINALNMIALHFRWRLHQYIQFRYAKKGDTELKYRETRRLVDSCYRVRSAPEKDDDGNPTGKTVKVWTEWDDTDDPIEQELREWLGIVPWKWQIRANCAHFLHKLYDMLAWIEKFVDKHPKTKGARLYSLLPVATTFQAAYVKLNASTLHGLLARLIDLPEVEDFLKKELNIVPARKRTGSQLPFDKKTFQKNRSEVTRKVFDVEQLETRNRKFADEIKTNGYGASITMIRPVTTISVVVVEKKASKKKRKKSDGTAELVSKEKKARKKKVKTPEDIAEEDTFAKELFKLGPDYSPDVLIGIDPGMRSLVTAVSVGHLPRRRRRQKSRRGFHRRHRTCRARRKERVIEISTPEYRHLARMNDFRFYNENLKMQEPWYAGVIRAMPPFKTSSYDLYFQRLQFFWKHLRFLLAFSAEQAFLRWRFTRDRAKMKALDTLAKRLGPKASKQVCIAYGGWSRRNGIKGHASGPVKGFVEALKRRATVIPMDEYRTSITCSCCNQRLKQARLFTKMKRKEDEVDIRQKERPSKKEVKEIVEMARFRNPKLADKKVVLKCTRNVLRCTNSGCKANFWNRDVNAARNMLELLKSGLKGKHGARRLRAFRRGMNVWGSQGAAAARADGTQPGEEEEDYEVAESGKDALIVLVDARAAMFAPYTPAADDDSSKAAPATWFHAVVELVMKLLKAKVIANDNSLLSVVFFGSQKRGEANNLENVYEFQTLGYPSASRIKDLQVLLEDGFDAQSEFQSMQNSDKIAISNALWHCGIAFSNANLKKKDTQRVWLFTNDDSPPPPDAEEKGRVQKQVQNHVELKRTLNLFYITPPGKNKFDLSKFYACVFKDYSQETGNDDDEPVVGADGSVIQYQPAFPVDSLEDLMEGSLRKRFRKRRLTSFPLHITKDVSIGVELYALAVVQKKSPPVALDASTNTPLKSETKWLCEDTGAYLTPDQIKRYIEYGGKRVYFSRDDVVQIKHYDSPGMQIICFKPISTLTWNANVRSPYFVYPSEGYIEGSSKAFVALLNAMAKKQRYALARLIARKSSEPRLVALLPQEEIADELGQVQPSGFNVIFLSFLDDIRDIPVEAHGNATDEQVDAAKALISKLKLTEVPSFENPELQKHYSSVQALALAEEELEFDEKKDTTLPDEEGFAQEDVKEAILAFKDVCGGELINQSNLKRKSSATPARKTAAKKGATSKVDTDRPSAGDDFSKEEWGRLIASNAIQKKTVAQIKDFLQSHGISAIGKKSELIDKVRDFVES